MWEIRIVAGRIGGLRPVGERVRPRVWRKDLCFVRKGVRWECEGWLHFGMNGMG